MEVAGESFYRDAIAEIVGLAGESFGQTLYWASLVPEPENPYSPTAVRVDINGKKVGYIPKEASPAFVPVALRITALGCDAQCAAAIVGGGGKKGKKIFGVILDLGTPDQCIDCLGEPS